MAGETARDFVREYGLPFLAHLLRRLSDDMVAQASEFYAARGLAAPARTASTLLLLRDEGPQSVTALAAKLRQSHPLAITWIRQLRTLGFVEAATDETDKRRTLVSLTEAGREEARRMAEALDMLGRAYAQLLSETRPDLLDALWRLEDMVAGGELLDRLRALEGSAAAGPGGKS